MNIFLSGANGMVGQNILQNTKSKNYNFIAPPKKSLNLLKTDEIHHFFQKHSIDLVIHAAGIVGGIEANISNPSRYLLDNTQMGINLINVCKKNKIKNLINLASSCMYPKDSNEPLTENMILSGPLEPTNEGYALAKILVTRLCEYISFDKKNFSYKTVIPCNLYGEFDKFDPIKGHFVGALIEKISEAKKNKKNSITLFGDGTPYRQFMHAKDLAIIIKEMILKDKFYNMNIATEENYTIDTIAKLALRACNCENIEINYDTSKPNGQMRKDIQTSRLKKYFPDFKPIKLEKGIGEIYKKRFILK